jgi:hypothetical protein
MADIKMKLMAELNINPEDDFPSISNVLVNTVISVFVISNIILGDFLKINIV